jgi:hypothetical protein
VAENTVCKDCESFNQVATRLFKLENKTPEQEAMLERAADMYRALHRAGLHPIGAYAKHVLGLPIGRLGVRNESSESFMERYINSVLGNIQDNEQDLIGELTAWLSRELTEEPDYYLDKVYGDLKVACRSDDITEVEAKELEKKGLPFAVKNNYKELLDAVLERFYAYEDEYDWDKED